MTLIRTVDQIPSGHLRVETGLVYPDGSSIDVFVAEGTQANTLFEPVQLTDLGQTTGWLLDMQVKPWLSQKRKRLMEDTLRVMGVRQEGGALVLPKPEDEPLGIAILRLAQTCARVADIAFTRRASLQTVFSERVEEILADAEVDYVRDVELTGKFGAVVRVDFLASGARTKSAVLMWATANPTQAHVQANEIFRRWYDLDVPERQEQRITVFDDAVNVYRPEDMKRLEEFSTVLPGSESRAVAQLLAA